MALPVEGTAGQHASRRRLKRSATVSAGGSEAYVSQRTLKARQGFRDDDSGQPSIALAGTLIAGGVTEESLVAGGETLIITLTGDVWAGDLGSDNAITDAFIASITGPGVEAAGWNDQILAGDGSLDNTDLVRTSDTIATLTLPASASFSIAADEVITAAIPEECVRGEAAPVLQTFTITANVTITLSGTAVAGGVLESEIVTGSETVIITLAGDTWVATMADDNAITTAFLAAIIGDLADAAGWNAQMSLAHGDLVRTDANILTLTLPATAGYSITSDDETVSVPVQADAVTGGIVPDTKTFVITEGS